MSDDKSAAVELQADGELQEGRSYVVVLGSSGRQHNLILDKVGSYYLFGRAGLERQVLLVKNDTSPYLSLRVVDASMADSFRKSGRIVFETGCVLPSETQKLRVRIADAPLIEDSWRSVVPTEAVSDDGDPLDTEAIVEAIPALKAHRIAAGNFVETPSAWPASSVPVKKPKFLIAGDEESTDSEG